MNTDNYFFTTPLPIYLQDTGKRKKYELIPTENEFFRIRALIDFGDVKRGDIGGLVQYEHNLSHDGDCWIFQDARCVGTGRVEGNAKILERASVYQDGRVYDDAIIGGDAEICGSSKVFDTSLVIGKLKVRYADIGGNAEIHSQSDYMVFKNWWGQDMWLTWTRSNGMWRHGCFYGNTIQTIDHFMRKSREQGKQIIRLVEYIENSIPFELSEKEKMDF